VVSYYKPIPPVLTLGIRPTRTAAIGLLVLGYDSSQDRCSPMKTVCNLLLALVACCATSGRLSAATINIITDSRTISATASATNAAGITTVDSHNDAAVPLAPFNSTVTSTATAPGANTASAANASQTSSFTATSFALSTHLFQSSGAYIFFPLQPHPTSSADAKSTAQISFTVSDPTAFSLFFDPDVSRGGGDPGIEPFEFQLGLTSNVSGNVFNYTFTTLPLTFISLLQPGEVYSLNVLARAFTPSPDPLGTFSTADAQLRLSLFQDPFPVPDQAGILSFAIALGCVVLIQARRTRKAVLQ